MDFIVYNINSIIVAKLPSEQMNEWIWMFLAKNKRVYVFTKILCSLYVPEVLKSLGYSIYISLVWGGIFFSKEPEKNSN